MSSPFFQEQNEKLTGRWAPFPADPVQRRVGLSIQFATKLHTNFSLYFDTYCGPFHRVYGLGDKCGPGSGYSAQINSPASAQVNSAVLPHNFANLQAGTQLPRPERYK